MSEPQEALSSGLKAIGCLEDEIRDFINTGRNQVRLLPKRSTWNQICSSLDVIGDTTLSIADYISASFPTTPGLQYIYTYGLLQALFLQQDAIRHLAEAFELAHTPSQRLLKIRELRNSAIGHRKRAINPILPCCTGRRYGLDSQRLDLCSSSGETFHR